MATIVLGAVGGMIGGSIGGSVLGLSGAVIGRAVGSVVGRSIDQRIMGGGSEVVEHGRIDRLHLTGASEGATLPRIVGRMRVGGHVIWSTRFREHRHEETTGGGGGKGRPRAPERTTVSYGYSISMAMAVAQGPIRRIGRVWADGREVAKSSLNMRVYAGTEDQLPDPLIEAVDGAAPAYRGTAYVVFEELDLGPFGNRMPQFSFEVVAAASAEGEVPPAADLVQGVALVPGSGEYALATTSVHYDYGGEREAANVNTVEGRADFGVALEQMREELPRLRTTSLVVSWFGDDLRCGSCRVMPKVEQTTFDGVGQAWHVSGLMRAQAEAVPRLEGRPVYGGTPSDASVIEAIRAMTARGLDVTFYPFILMAQMAGNGLPDPWGGTEQAVLPWRGRITCSTGAGRPGVDGTAQAEAEVAAFFGTARAADFVARDMGGEAGVVIDGPEEWSYRRFILHYAKLCAVAGGVEAFCIGSEMRGLTQVMGPEHRFPAVEAMRDLAREVRTLLPDAKIGYAADWSEYFGYHPAGTGNVFHHLDPLWSDPVIDFVGIDNYMPLADWRDGSEHADAAWGDVTDLGYLQANIEGGEGYDWYYASEADRDAQMRTPIRDGAHGEDWVFRFKDLPNWWGKYHHDRIGGVRAHLPTGWQPGSKPVRFLEYGCAAIDKGANQPNKFLDPKSSESRLPRYSDGRRDDAMQMQYLRAFAAFYEAPERNLVSEVYGGRMVDMAHSCVWAWDTRPFPAFPELPQVWSDAGNWRRGHWLSGRAALMPLATVIKEICQRAGVRDVDVSGVRGAVRGVRLDGVRTAREMLQPLMLAHGVEVAERGGRLVFFMRMDGVVGTVPAEDLVRVDGATVERVRAPEAEMAGRVLVQHVDAEGDFAARVGDAVHPGTGSVPVRSTELPMVMTAGEGAALAERFLSEARVARDAVTLSLPPSRRDVAAGTTIRLGGDDGLWRVDRIEDGAGGRRVEAVRTERPALRAAEEVEGDGPARARPLAPLPVEPVLMDLPLLRGDEDPAAPYVAVGARPWPGAVAIHAAAADADYRLAQVVDAPAVIGTTLSEMPAAAPAVWDIGAELLVRIPGTALQSASEAAVLAGANAAAIGTGAPGGWELFQFREARLVSAGVWALSRRLRGQRGTERAIRDPWPVGSRVVLLDEAVRPLPLAPDHVGLERHYRIGPASQPMDHESYVHRVAALGGRGLRPYAPVHLRIDAAGDEVVLRWVRRSRVPGDGWGLVDVPLGEALEAYEVTFVSRDGTVVDRRAVDRAELRLAASDWQSLRDGGAVAVRVAQMSDVAGPGDEAELHVA